MEKVRLRTTSARPRKSGASVRSVTLRYGAAANGRRRMPPLRRPGFGNRFRTVQTNRLSANHSHLDN